MQKLDILLEKLGVRVTGESKAHRLQPLDKAGQLAPGWIEKFSDTYAVPFYYNSVTKVSSWSRPVIGDDGQESFVDPKS